MNRIQSAAEAYTLLALFINHETLILALYIFFISHEVLDFFVSSLLNQSSSAECSCSFESCSSLSALILLTSDLL